MHALPFQYWLVLQRFTRYELVDLQEDPSKYKPALQRVEKPVSEQPTPFHVWLDLQLRLEQAVPRKHIEEAGWKYQPELQEG